MFKKPVLILFLIFIFAVHPVFGGQAYMDPLQGPSTLPNEIKVDLVVIGAAEHYSGTGSPEGVITAPVGSTYSRTDGGSGTTLYIKESGTDFTMRGLQFFYVDTAQVSSSTDNGTEYACGYQFDDIEVWDGMPSESDNPVSTGCTPIFSKKITPINSNRHVDGSGTGVDVTVIESMFAETYESQPNPIDLALKLIHKSSIQRARHSVSLIPPPNSDPGSGEAYCVQ